MMSLTAVPFCKDAGTKEEETGKPIWWPQKKKKKKQKTKNKKQCSCDKEENSSQLFVPILKILAHVKENFVFVFYIVNFHYVMQTRHFKILLFDLLFAHCLDIPAFPASVLGEQR